MLTLRAFFLLLLLTSWSGHAACQNQPAVADRDEPEDRDLPVLRYYWKQGEFLWERSDSILGTTRWQADARIRYEQLGDSGRVIRAESLIVRLYSTGRELDSTRQLSGPKKSVRLPDFGWFNPFGNDTRLTFYPNDTGEAGLEIGFEPVAEHQQFPLGLLQIDRRSGIPMSLLLSYAGHPGFRRHSRGMRFINLNGLILADSLWESGVEDRLFGSESFRFFVSITNITL